MVGSWRPGEIYDFVHSIREWGGADCTLTLLCAEVIEVKMRTDIMVQTMRWEERERSGFRFSMHGSPVLLRTTGIFCSMAFRSNPPLFPLLFFLSRAFRLPPYPRSGGNE